MRGWWWKLLLEQLKYKKEVNDCIVNQNQEHSNINSNDLSE